MWVLQIESESGPFCTVFIGTLFFCFLLDKYLQMTFLDQTVHV